MQVAGKRCEQCGKRIVAAIDVLACAACDVALHSECTGEVPRDYRKAEARRVRPRCPRCNARLRTSSALEVARSESVALEWVAVCPLCRMPHGVDDLCAVPGGLRERALAQVVDGVIAVSPFFVIASLDQPGRFAWVALGLCLAYYLFADGLPRGQSLGKRLFGIAVVQEGTGKPCGWLRSGLRNVTQVVGWVDWLWILGRDRKRAGDYVASTRVIRLR